MAKLRVDLTGRKFCKLRVLEYMGRNKRKNSQWLCLCECGNNKTADGSDLQSGNTKSCGCLKIKHGHVIKNHASQVYSTWRQMKQRCSNTKNKAYPSYGGRGVTVCKRWLMFENFLKDMGNPPTSKYSIDRINNNGNYCKSNCRWSTREQQQSNMRSNYMITFNNKTQCLSAWSRKTKIGQKCLWHRLVTLSWSIEKALTTPVQKRRSKK